MRTPELPRGFFPRMGHGFPRNYIDITPQENLYDPTRVLGSPCTRAWATVDGIPDTYVGVQPAHTDGLLAGDLIRIKFPFGSLGWFAFGAEEIFKIAKSEPGRGIWIAFEDGEPVTGVDQPIHGSLADLRKRVEEKTSVKWIRIYRDPANVKPDAPAVVETPIEAPRSPFAIEIDPPTLVKPRHILPRAIEAWLGATLLGLGIFMFAKGVKRRHS